jgi:hypothetical protein
MWTAKCVLRCSTSGQPNTVNDAGGGSVSHMASIAASFIRWLSPQA